MIGNYNFTDGMYINYDNGYMNPGYYMYNNAPGQAQGCMSMAWRCPFMYGQGVNANNGMRQGCPMMYSTMQYSNTMPVYNNMYSMGYMPGMVSMRAVSVKDIQD